MKWIAFAIGMVAYLVVEGLLEHGLDAPQHIMFFGGVLYGMGLLFYVSVTRSLFT